MTVTVYFNIIQTGSSYKQGNVPDRQIYSQLAIMNTVYTPSGIQFKVCSHRPIRCELNAGLHTGSDRPHAFFAVKPAWRILQAVLEMCKRNLRLFSVHMYQ